MSNSKRQVNLLSPSVDEMILRKFCKESAANYLIYRRPRVAISNAVKISVSIQSLSVLVFVHFFKKCPLSNLLRKIVQKIPQISIKIINKKTKPAFVCLSVSFVLFGYEPSLHQRLELARFAKVNFEIQIKMDQFKDREVVQAVLIADNNHYENFRPFADETSTVNKYNTFQFCEGYHL